MRPGRAVAAIFASDHMPRMTQRLLNRVVEVKGKEDGEREPRGEDGAQIHVDRRLPDQYIQIRQYKSMIRMLWIEIGKALSDPGKPRRMGP